jgi:hypothetical protein
MFKQHSEIKIKSDRHILRAFLIPFIIEYVQVGPLLNLSKKW